MRGSVDRLKYDHECVMSCLRYWSPNAVMAAPSDVLDDVLQAYGDMGGQEICECIASYALHHLAELENLLGRHARDSRYPALLRDAALLCVLERLEHDRYALRRVWIRRRDPAELRRIADLWGIRVGL